MHITIALLLTVFKFQNTESVSQSMQISLPNYTRQLNLLLQNTSKYKRTSAKTAFMTLDNINCEQYTDHEHN